MGSNTYCGLFFINVLHDLFHPAAQQLAQLIERVGGDIVASLHGVIVGQRKPHLSQSVGCDPFFLHRLEQRLVADQLAPPPNSTSIGNIYETLYLLYFVYVIIDI